MANYIYIATSLDGFIATKDGGLNWLSEIPNPDQSDFGFAEFMNGIDAIVMGRNTFEVVTSFGIWPYEKPVFVLSNTLQAVPEEFTDKAEIIQGKPSEVMQTLNDQGYKNLYIDGGKTIQSFLKEELIDEMILTRIPILLGEGIPLFGKLEQAQLFEHKKTEVFNNALVKSCYTRSK